MKSKINNILLMVNSLAIIALIVFSLKNNQSIVTIDSAEIIDGFFNKTIGKNINNNADVFANCLTNSIAIIAKKNNYVVLPKAAIISDVKDITSLVATNIEQNCHE